MEPATGESGDGELVTHARRGDVDAFEALVRRYESTAVRVASVVCGSDGAEDAVQEGFIRAYRSLEKFDAGRPFRPWLLRIVVNVAKNRVRAEHRHLQLSLRSAAHRRQRRCRARRAPRRGTAPGIGSARSRGCRSATA